MGIHWNNYRPFHPIFYKKKVVALLTVQHKTSFFKKLYEFFVVNGRNFRHSLTRKREAIHDE